MYFLLLMFFSFSYASQVEYAVQREPLISHDMLKKNYNLMIKAKDDQGRIFVAVVPGDCLCDEEPVPLTKEYFMYNVTHWSEVCSLIKNVKKPADVNCFFVSLEKDSQHGDVVFCELPTEHAQCSLLPEAPLVLQEAVLVPNIFVKECKLTRHTVSGSYDTTPNEFQPMSLDDVDIEFDEDEVIEFSTSNPPSGLMVYAREIGVTLLMRSIAFTDYLNNKLQTIKNYLYSRYYEIR